MIRLPWRRVLPPGPARRHADVSPGGERASTLRDASAEALDASRSGGVRGERAGFIVSGARSLQSRMSSLLAAGVMLSVGATMLAWYYADALSRPAAARPPVRASLPEGAGVGMTLPPFGSNAAPRTPGSVGSLPSASSPASRAAAVSPAGEALPPAAPVSVAPLLEAYADHAGGLPRGSAAPPRPSARQQILDRRLSGEVFTFGGGDTSSNTAASDMGERPIAAASVGNVRAQTPPSTARGGALETLLHPDVLKAARAQVLPTPRLLLPKGTFIDCTLETAIDSTLPGMTTCVTATDTFGADGTVVLLERGTKLIGETRGEVHQGEARVFVVWTEARTPTGVVVHLDSPGTDALGRSGLEGKVNRHFWQRFGAAALVSMVDGAVQSEMQPSSRGGTIVLDPTASQDVLTEILRGTVNIPPTLRVRNGARIQVLVARDVDFRPVYELEPR